MAADGSIVRRHAHAAATAARQAVRLYRDAFAVDGAGPGFADALAKAAAIEGYTSTVELALLHHLAVVAPARGSVVEIGSYLGRSSVVLADACRRAQCGQLVAVDLHTAALGYRDRPPRDTRQEFLDNVAEAGVDEHVRLVHRDSADAGHAWDGGPVRMLFIDGWHSTEAVLADARAWAPHCAPNCWLGVDVTPTCACAQRFVAWSADRVVRGDSALVGKIIASRRRPHSPARRSRPGHAPSREWTIAGSCSPSASPADPRWVARAALSRVVPGWAKARHQHQRERRLVRRAARVGRLYRERHDQVVRHGPFADLRYPDDLVQVPKLLGTYELELHPAVERLIDGEPATVVNVGAGEGYYAVGLARRLPRARVLAFDLNEDEQRRCRTLAELNDVADRVAVAGECTPDTLRALPDDDVALVMDCEGCELALLRPEQISPLRRWRILVELHDFLDPATTRTIRDRFRPTHDLELIAARARDPGGVDELAFLPPTLRAIALDEARPPGMHWADLRPRAHA